VSGQDCGAGLPAERIALRINAALPPGRPDSSRLGRLTYHASHVDPVPSTPNRPKVKSPIDFHYLGSRDRRLRSQDSFAVDFRGGPLFPPKHARAWRPECGTGSEVTAVPAVSATANPGSISVYVKRESLPLSAVIVKHHETEKRDEGSFVAADVSSQSAPSPLAQLSSSMTNGLRDRGTLPVPSEAHLIPRQLGRTESRASSGFAQFAQFPQWGSDVYEWWTLNHLILRSTPEACVSKDGNTQGARARQRYGSYSALIETRLSRFRRFAPKRRTAPQGEVFLYRPRRGGFRDLRHFRRKESRHLPVSAVRAVPAVRRAGIGCFRAASVSASAHTTSGAGCRCCRLTCVRLLLDWNEIARV
jgi:hypothetical protein